MKIYLTQKSYFTYRGLQSGELDLLGKTCKELMRERLGAEEGEPVGEEYVLLDPVYPFLTREALCCYLDGREGSYFFPGGKVLRRNSPLSHTPRMTTGELGRGLFTLSDYAVLLGEAENRSAELHRSRGALIEEGAVVSFSADLAAGVHVEAGARVLGKSVLGENAEIGAGSRIENSFVGENSVVRASVLVEARVGKNCSVGPFAYLRRGSVVGDSCRVGDFVEIKNATIGRETKISHLAYVGDADVGKRCNVGCGVVFANYSGKKKSRTVVGDGCFLGSNCNLIAPLAIGDGAFVAAGTTLTRDLNDADFCIGRCRETVRPNRGKEYYDPI